MNLDNQILMGIHAGHVPDKDTLKLILEQFNPTAIGMSVQNLYTPDGSTDKIPDLAIVREDAANLNLDTLVDFFDKSKEWPATAYFGKLDGEKNSTCIQPFCVLDGNGQPFMSIFLEGTLNGNDEPMTHTEQYNYVNGVLIPKINDYIADFAESDEFLEKIAAKLKGDIFKKDFMQNVGHRAVLQIMPVEGDLINLGKNDLHADFTWGWMSQRLTAKAKAAPIAEATKVVVAAAKNRFGFGKSAPAASVPASPPPVPGPSEVKDAATKGSEDRYPAKPKEQAPSLAARPPAWAQTNDDLKLWYKIVGNAPTGELKTVLPTAWKKRLPIGVLDEVACKINNLSEFKTYALKRTLMTSGGTATSAGKVPEATATADAKALDDTVLPIIVPKAMAKILDFVAKHVDTSSKEIAGPKSIQDMEKALPKFSSEVGLSLDEIRNWPANVLAQIGKEDLWALVCYAIEWRAEARRLATGQPVAGTKETDKAVTTTTVNGGTIKTESVSKEVHVAAKEILKPTGGRFGFRKVA